MTNAIKVGVLPWGQRTDWPSLLRVGQRADELGYDSLWTWDHLYPIQGDWRGPIFEGYMILAGWAGVTSRATLGLMVGANTFRNPALTAKMATTLDHMSNGRAILGIGGAWFETRARGLRHRLRLRLRRAARLARRGGRAHAQMLRGRGDGARPALPREARPQRPAADPGTPADPDRRRRREEDAAHGRQVRRRLEHRRRPRLRPPQGRGPAPLVRRVGRDESEIERTLGLGLVVIRDDPAEARRVDAFPGASPGLRRGRPSGSAEEIADLLVPYVELGFRHIFFDAPAPFDEETLERFVGEVKPMLEQAAAVAAR